MNKYLPAINLFFVLTIAVITTLSVKIWTHPTYPTRVDGASVVGSPKSLNKLTVSRLGGNAGTVSQVVQGNIFRRQRREYIPPPTARPILPSVASKPALPPPNLVLKGILMLGGTKIAILEGNYWTFQGNQKVKKKVKKRGYSLGQIVGDFELIEIDKTSVTLNDKNGRGVRLRLAKRSPEKIIHREGTVFFQKNKKYDPRKFKATPVKNRPTRTTTAKPKAKPTALAPATAPVFRISGAKTPAPAAVHISGR
ncbi:hypothetical protein OAT11_05365 [Nitrospinaceae bacterium]|nr:hypothetical protein [Nitrospinaceae bacterium]